MQIKNLHRSFYSIDRIESKVKFADRYKEFRQYLVESIDKYETAQKEKISKQARKKLGIISKATYYRFQHKLNNLDAHIPPPKRGPKTKRKPAWSHELKELILKLRKSHPTYGKNKLVVILARDHGIKTSESTAQAGFLKA